MSDNAVLDNHKIWDILYSKCCRKLSVFVNVYLANRNFAVFLVNLFKNWGNHLTWTAPVRIKVD